MGTNYYARKFPTPRQVHLLKEKINLNYYNDIKRLVNSLYGTRSQDNPSGSEIHLGKRSGGWKFLWNPNIYRIDKDSTSQAYPLTKQGIVDFLMQEDVSIYDEYNRLLDKKEFIEMAFNWDGYDSDSYHEAHPEVPGYIHHSKETEFFKSLGYELNKTNSEFYSDGLRFAACTEFS